MKKTLTTSEAVSELMNDEYAGWSYRGARALIEYLEELEQELDIAIELDVAPLRCEYSEYESALNAFEDYGYHIDYKDELEDMTDDEKEKFAFQFLEELTTVIQFDGGVIIEDY